MASSSPLLSLFSSVFLITLSVAQRPNAPNAIAFPVTKDGSTLQYVTQVHQGSPRVPTRLVVDLGGRFPWLDCTSGHVSSSQRPIPYGSLQCSKAKPNACNFHGSTPTCFSSSRFSPCGLNTVNTITGLATCANLAEDILTVHHVDPPGLNLISTVDYFMFTCASPLLLKGLASGTRGMLGLGRTRISMPSQLATALGHSRRFAVCLSPSHGVLVSGHGLPAASIFGSNVSNSLLYTPLISSSPPDDYYINVKSIKINGKKLSLNTSLLCLDQNGIGGTKLSTIVPYTTMENSIYQTFTKAFLEMANSVNLTRVAPVAPFGLCFGPDGVQNYWAGPTVPVVDLVLQSEMVKWRIHGRNSMVDVGDGVTCLGFLDGGLSPKASIVIGGYQLEDNLLDFDLGNSMLGFSSSLLARGNSCSDYKVDSVVNESL